MDKNACGEKNYLKRLEMAIYRVYSLMQTTTYVVDQQNTH